MSKKIQLKASTKDWSSGKEEYLNLKLGILKYPIQTNKGKNEETIQDLSDAIKIANIHIFAQRWGDNGEEHKKSSQWNHNQ
jgi:hypothetical protein